MDKKNICDDRDTLENAEKIRNMTDEEFNDYVNRNSKLGDAVEKD